MASFLFIFTYLLLILYSIFFGVRVSCFILLVSTFIASARSPNALFDYGNYLSSYSEHKSDGFELGYQFFQKIAYDLDLNGAVFLFLFFIITIFVKLKSLKVAIDYFDLSESLFLIGYFSYLFFLHDLVQIRAGLALGIAYYAYFSFLKYGKNHILPFFIAPLFHSSSIIFGISFFVTNNKNKTTPFFYVALPLLGFLISSTIDFNFFTVMFGNFFERLTLYGDAESVSISLKQILLLSVLIYFWMNCDEFNPNLIVVGKLCSISLFLFFIFHDVGAVAFRLYELFEIFFLILMVAMMRRGRFIPYILFLSYVMLSLRAVFLIEQPLFTAKYAWSGFNIF